MKQAITTKYLGPTATQGNRCVASCAAGRIMIPWDFSLNMAENHTKAAQALLTKLDWPMWVARGVLKSGDHVFVF